MMVRRRQAGRKKAPFYVPERTRIEQGHLFLHSALAFSSFHRGFSRDFACGFPAFFQRANAEDIGSIDAGFAGFSQITKAMPHYGIQGSHSSCSVRVSGPSLPRFYAIQAEKMRA